MFRTEVVKSKNFRKTKLFKIYNVLSLLILGFILAMVLNLWGSESAIGKFIAENYSNIVQPVVLAIALVLFVTSIVIRNAARSPKRLGSLEADQNEIRYLVDDEVQETIALSSVESIDFEFYSFRMRGNPMGCMNYLTINKRDGSKTYEIVIANSLVKAEFGSLLADINKKVPVKVTYSYFLKRIFKDNDFKF